MDGDLLRNDPRKATFIHGKALPSKRHAFAPEEASVAGDQGFSPVGGGEAFSGPGADPRVRRGLPARFAGSPRRGLASRPQGGARAPGGG